jgi:hypothetical protein
MRAWPENPRLTKCKCGKINWITQAKCWACGRKVTT